MKKVFTIVILCVLGLSVKLSAENRWHVYGGVNLSHMTEKPVLVNDSYGWGAGGYVGGGYEIRFSDYVSLSPQLEISYLNNGASLNLGNYDFYLNHSEWRGMWNVTIPIAFNVRIPFSEKVGMLLGAGPYLQETFVLREYGFGTSKKETNNDETFAKRFNFGMFGEAAIETGSHLGYVFRVQYPFLKETWSRKTLTLSLGVRYYF